MSKAARTVGMIAGAVALVATGLGAVGVLGGLAAGSTATAIATYAGLAATAANIVSNTLAKPPRVRGQLMNRTIGANQPLPYLMGEAYSAGVQVIDVGYGATLKKVPNPYRFIAVVHSCCGPVEQLVETQADFAALAFAGTAASGYFNGFLYRSAQLGQRPEAAALAPQWAGAPGWTAAHKLSGMAAEGFSFKFDKEGKVFASGLPALGSVWRGVKAYDPRLDGTYPGGSGPQRITDEATWTYTRNPALHALTYAYGRYVNGRKVFGVDLKGGGILIAPFVAWANVCDLNGWTVNGQIFEPGDKWANLKAIGQAGGAEPMFEGGLLSFAYSAPRVSLDTIALADLADGELSAPAMKPWRERINTVVPKFRSPAHQWGMTAGSAVVDATSVAEDGETKSEELPLELVTNATQAAQLAGYRIGNAREREPIVLRCKPRLADYGPGDCLTLSVELAAMLAVTTRKCTVRRCEIDPAAGVVTLSLATETDAKHDFALGRTTALPPSVPPPSADVADAIASAIYLDPATDAQATANALIDLHLVALNDGGVAQIVGNDVACTSSGPSWSTGFYSQETFLGGGVVSARIGAAEHGAIGLAFDVGNGQIAAGNAGFTIARVGGNVSAWVNGTELAFAGSGISDETSFSVRLAGGTAEFFAGTARVHVVTGLPQDRPVRVKGYLRGVGAKVSGIAFAPASISATVAPWIRAGAAADDMVQAGSTLTRAKGGGAWNCLAYTPDTARGGARFSGRFARTDGHAIIGLCQLANAAASLNMELGVYGAANGRAYVWTSAGQGADLGPYSVADVWSVGTDGVTNAIFKNGATPAIYSAAATAPALADYVGKVEVHGAVAGAGVRDALFQAASANNADALGGVNKPEAKADVTRLVTGAYAAITVQADYQGNVAAGELPRTVAFRYTRGTADVTTAASWAVTVVSGTAGVTIGAATGQLTINSIGSPKVTLKVTGTIDGVARTATLLVDRADAAQPPATGGGSGSGSGSNSGGVSFGTSLTSYSAAAVTLQVTAASATATLSAPLEFKRNSPATGTTSAAGKWQYRAGTSGAWIDVAAEIASSSSSTTSNGDGFPDRQPGTLTVNMSQGGLTVGSVYQFQLLLRASDTSGVQFTGQSVGVTT